MNKSNAESVIMGAVELNVKDIANMKKFYEELVGLEELEFIEKIISLGENDQTVIRLYQEDDYNFAPRGEAGLYHTAIVYPTRYRLAEAVKRILYESPELYQGSADHLVTEAFYFSDPEGNGVELYFDKPRSDWTYESGKPVMGSIYLDKVEYIKKYSVIEEMKRGIQMGHVHLKVGNIEQARKFYAETLMFDIMNHRQDSLFISRDGYHHHLGMNIWESAGARERKDNTYGLRSFEIIYKEKSVFESVLKNLKSSNLIIDEKELNHITTFDPWMNRIEIKFE